MPALLQGASEAADLPGGYGAALLQTLLALGAVSLLAWVVLRWSAKRGFGMGPSGGRLRVLERVPLDQRRALYLVRVGDRVLLVGAGEGASPTVLAELDPSELPPAPERPPGNASFAAILRRIGGRGDRD